MLGILCEKPSAARNFAKALGGVSGTFNGEQYVIVASVGHIYEFDDPHKMVPAAMSETYRKWNLANLPWDETLFNWKRVQKKDTADVKARIIAGLKNCDEIAIATDVDPSGEGQLLAWEILDECGFKPKKWSRFYFTDEAAASIQKAFKTRKPIVSMDQDPEYWKSYYRARWDMLSMQFTRVASCLTGVKLREGRLKSAMAVITGDGLKAYNDYKKIPFYEWRFRDNYGNMFSNPNEPRFPNKADLKPIYHDSAVIVDSTENKATAPPKLIDLATLSAQLATKGIKAKQVLDVYQKMYEDQVVSYPRTEDKCITPEQFDELLPLVDKIAAVVGVDASILTHRTPRKTHVKVGGAHGANRPGTNVPSSLDALSKYGAFARDIYEILARNYLAMLCEDYLYVQQKGHLKDYPDFKGTANQMTSMGFKLIYNDPNDEEDDTNGHLLGDTASPYEHEGFPPRPPKPTVKWLMKQLEKADVGTGATRTSTFAEVSNSRDDSALIKETKGAITLTEKGEMSYLLLPNTHIGSLEITKEVFDQMAQIAKGQLDPEECLMGVRQMVVDDIETMRKNMVNVQAQFPDAGKTQVKDKATGTYAPTGKEISFSAEWGGHKFTDDEIDKLLSGAEITFEATKKDGSGTYTATGKLEEQTYKGKKFWGFAYKPQTSACPPDKFEGVYVPKKKTVRFKREWGGHKFTDAECNDLLAGKEISFQALSKAGKPYTAKGKLAEQSYNGTKFWGFKADFK